MSERPPFFGAICECGSSSWIQQSASSGGRLLCRACGSYTPLPLSPYRKELADRVEAGLPFSSPCEECTYTPVGSGEIYPNCKKFNCNDLKAFTKAAIELNCEKIRTAFKRRGLPPEEPVQQFLDNDGCIRMWSLPREVRIQVKIREGDEGLIVMLPPRQMAHQASRRELFEEAQPSTLLSWGEEEHRTKPFDKVSAVAEEVAAEEEKDV